MPLICLWKEQKRVITLQQRVFRGAYARGYVALKMGCKLPMYGQQRMVVVLKSGCTGILIPFKTKLLTAI